MADDSKSKYHILKKIGIFLLVGLFLFFVTVILFIRSPWGQSVIVDTAVDYIEDKTGTNVDIERLFITFSGNIFLEGVFLEDKTKDTLLYSKVLEVDMALLPLIRQKSITVEAIEWEGVTANIHRAENDSTYNFQFLIDAFVPADSTQTTTATSTDTSQATMPIQIGTVDLLDFDLELADAYAGMFGKVKLGALALEMETLDLDQMLFEINELEVSKLHANYRQTKPFPDDTTSAEDTLPLPILALREAVLNDVTITYEDHPNQLYATAVIPELSTEIPEVDLQQQKVNVAKLHLDKNAFELKMLGSETSAVAIDSSANSVAQNPGFEWPKWVVDIEDVEIKETNVHFITKKTPALSNQLDPEHIVLSQINVSLPKFEYAPGKANLELKKTNFYERSGFHLESASMTANLNSNQLEVKNIGIQTGNSRISGTAQAAYKTIEDLWGQPEAVRFHAKFPDLAVGLSDAFYVQPALRDNSYIKGLAKYPFRGKVYAEGTMAQINLRSTEVRWHEKTQLQVEGLLQNVTDPETLRVELDPVLAYTTRNDVRSIMDTLPGSVQFPKFVKVQGRLEGGMTQGNAKVTLSYPEGVSNIKGKFRNTETLAFELKAIVDSLPVGSLLQSNQLGKVSGTVKASGQGTSVNTLDAEATANISAFDLQGYRYANIDIEGKAKQGKGTATVAINDPNLQMKMDSRFVLDSVRPQVHAIADVKGVDLGALGFVSNDIRTQFGVTFDFAGNTENFSTSARVEDAILVNNDERYPINDLYAEAESQQDSTHARIEHSLIQGELNANSSLAAMGRALRYELEKHINTTPTDSTQGNVRMQMEATVRPDPLLTDILLPGLGRMDTIQISARLNEAAHEVEATLTAPQIEYSGSTIDSLRFRMNSDQEGLNMNLYWKGIEAGPVAMQRTQLTGKAKNEEIVFSFESFDSTETVMHLGSRIAMEKDTLRYHIDPERLILNKKQWQVDPNNQMFLATEHVSFRDMTLSRNNQTLQLRSDLPQEDKYHIGILFDNFPLASILSVFNPDETLIGGKAQGEFIVEDPFQNTGLVADMKVQSMKVMGVEMGVLSLKGESKNRGNYTFDLGMQGPDIDFILDGSYRASTEAAQLNLDLVIDKFGTALAQQFAPEFMSESKGFLQGKVQLSGTTAEPEYSGTLDFRGVETVVVPLEATYSLPDESIRMDTKGVYLDQFTIQDKADNTFVINGSVGTRDFANPTFDLSLKADDFKAIDSEREDNSLFYGIVKIDTDLRITGDLAIPKVRGSVEVDNKSDFTVIVPEDQVDVVEREGVVLFVNKKNPDAIITRTDEQSSSSAVLTGYDIDTKLKVNKGAVFKIIVDERSGDNLRVTGQGDLVFGIEPNGRMILSGRYEVNDGHYEAGLYNLVKRKFDIARGSTITWQGDPYQANMDIRAIYQVETSASALMATKTSAESAGLVQQYQQELPFLVYLNVEGELLTPEISFALDMPEDEQGYAGGQVYGYVQQLNSREEELNKQVFSLLVLNRFFPGSGSDGSAGGPASIARDNVNKVLSSQLNTFSDKLIGKTGIELNFGLDSYTDYRGAGPQDRTQLDVSAQKRLLNDRLVVQVGSEVDLEGSSAASGQGTPVIGNVSLEYLLTENGRYRLKGFRKNEFESVIDGQLIVTGIAFIFNREFNKFRELFQKTAAEAKKNKEVETPAKASL